MGTVISKWHKTYSKIDGLQCCHWKTISGLEMSGPAGVVQCSERSCADFSTQRPTVITVTVANKAGSLKRPQWTSVIQLSTRGREIDR